MMKADTASLIGFASCTGYKVVDGVDARRICGSLSLIRLDKKERANSKYYNWAKAGGID